MRRLLILACIALMSMTGAASAQNMSLRGPAWAQPLLATDVIATTGGRAALNEEGIDVAARVTIAPTQGGVARVIRYEARGNDAKLVLRRFTGHPTTGWWLWGPDTPYVSAPSASVREEIATLVRSAIGLAGAQGAGLDAATCASREQAFVELALGTRSTSMTRACVTNNDAVGRLTTRLSELAGSRTEEELHAAAERELLEADAAFNALAQAEGVGAAFARYAASDALMFRNGQMLQGQEAVAGAYANWPAAARLQWTPRQARVSARGDMGWTWGDAIYIAANGAQSRSRYVTVWIRDWEGNWRFSYDGGIQGGVAAPDN